MPTPKDDDEAVFAGAIGCLSIFAMIAIFIIVMLVNSQPDNHVTQDKALARFKELAGTTNIEIVRHTSDNVFLGDAKEIVFELRIDGKPASGRCIDSVRSELTCVLYGPQ